MGFEDAAMAIVVVLAFIVLTLTYGVISDFESTGCFGYKIEVRLNVGFNFSFDIVGV